MKRNKCTLKTVASFGVLALAFGLGSCAGAASANGGQSSGATAMARTGIVDGAFLPCPGSPNCVSSMDSSGSAAITPLDYGALSREEALLRLLALLEADANCLIVAREELLDGSIYIHAEYRSKLFRFVDDVEFYFPPALSLIHVKSASRVGYSDMGVNRKRVEDIRARFMQG